MRRPLLALVLAALTASASAQTVDAYAGTLASGDATLSSGEYADAYTITVPRGAEVLMVSMLSDDLDAYLMARGPGGASEDNDDTGEGDLNATLVLMNPAPGEWTVSATSARSGETGAYHLVLGAGSGADVLERIADLTEADYRTETAPRTASASAPARGPKPGAAPSARTSGAATIRVVNQADQSLFYLYASRCTDSGWGDDRLGDETVSTGEAWTLSLEPGCWDLKAEFADGQTTEKRDWTLVPGPGTWTVTAD